MRQNLARRAFRAGAPRGGGDLQRLRTDAHRGADEKTAVRVFRADPAAGHGTVGKPGTLPGIPPGRAELFGVYAEEMPLR